MRIIAKLTKHYNGNNDDRSPDLVDAEVANVLPRKSVDVRDDGHPGYLCLHLFIPIIIIMAMTISAILK